MLELFEAWSLLASVELLCSFVFWGWDDPRGRPCSFIFSARIGIGPDALEARSSSDAFPERSSIDGDDISICLFSVALAMVGVFNKDDDDCDDAAFDIMFALVMLLATGSWIAFILQKLRLYRRCRYKSRVLYPCTNYLDTLLPLDLNIQAFASHSCSKLLVQAQQLPYCTRNMEHGTWNIMHRMEHEHEGMKHSHLFGIGIGMDTQHDKRRHNIKNIVA